MPSFCKSCVVLEKVCLRDPSIRFVIPARLRIAVADAGSASFAFSASGEICGEDMTV